MTTSDGKREASTDPFSAGYERRVWTVATATFVGFDLVALFRLTLGSALPGANPHGDLYMPVMFLLLAVALLVSPLWLLALGLGRIARGTAGTRAVVLAALLLLHAGGFAFLLLHGS